MNGIVGKFSMISVAVLVSGAMAMAQQTQTPMRPSTPATNNAGTMSQQEDQQMQMEGQQTAASSKMQDKSFLRKAAEGGMAEVQLGQMAQQKASSQDVKDFAGKMVQDHSQLNEQLKPIAQQEGVRPPKAMSKKDESEMRKLEALSGPEFDKAYMKMMVKDHKKDLREFKEEAGQTQNSQLKDAAQHGAQVIDQHLQLAEKIVKDHNLNAKGE